MRISRRLYKIAEKVSQGESAADIGTDHGYVPMLLVRNGVSTHVIMSDISDGSLAKAIETFELTGLNADPDCFRTGDGLETIKKGEVDDIIIAGLGGFTIIDILSADTDKSRSYRKLILQPRKHSGSLRHFLYTRGWDIIDEDLAISEVAGVEDTFGRIDDISYRNLADDHIDLDFWHQVGFDFDASVHFLMALLHAITHNVGDGHAGDS